MIRVDNMESYKELRESGYAGDILVLMKGGEDVGKETDGQDTGKETDGQDTDGKDTGKEEPSDNGSENNRVQFDYEKIIDGVTEKIKPLIQKQNRDAGTGVVKDDTLDDIMAKFAEM